ncbi:uncharacterized protein LOC123532111 [Mercenaria mercenaria]|uniref:uncharacterized protein LOC123532111 n=1 Tax=Mercenaria mercenaria TaxID=6596 RepID=UPI00234F3925|nr:uncharacterized protein LOC123532111 [Mercenaria mercenaria]
MSYIRQGDIMIHSVDLGQLTSGSRLGSNINHYDSMESAVTDSGEHYETLGRLRNNTGCCSGSTNQPSDINTSQKTYTRYIRPCGNFSNLNGNNNSVAKTTNETIPVQLRTLKKRRRVRSKCRTRNVIFGFIGGLVIGFVIASVCWLTIDRLKENKIVCEFVEKANDEKEEDKDNNRTKISSKAHSTQTTSHSQVTTPKELGKSTTSKLNSLTSKPVRPSQGTSVYTTVPKVTLQNVSNTELPITSQTSTSGLSSTTSNAISTATDPIPKSSSVIMLNTTSTGQTTTSQTLSNAETTDTHWVPTVSSDRAITSSTKTDGQQTRWFSSASRNVTETSTHTSTNAENITPEQTEEDGTKFFSSSDNPFKESSITTSSILETQSLQQTTDHPKEFNSSNEKNVSYSSNASTPTFSTVAVSSVIKSSTPGPSSAETSSFESQPQSPPTASMPTSQSSPTQQTAVVGKRSVQGGHVYIRWGSLSCPMQAELMYKGYAAGGHWQHQGGATNTICLPDIPTWGNYSDKEDGDRNLIYGTEYASTDASFLATTGKKMRYKDVPCSVCQATGRLSHVMIPGKTDCFPGWTQEYRGYLMGSGYIQNHASELICVDSSPDHVTGSDAAKGGNFLYFAEVRTGSLPSTTYVNGRELACVVCTL